MNAPRVSPTYSHSIHFDEGVVLVGEETSTVLEGRAIGVLLESLNDATTLSEVFDRMSPVFSTDVVSDAIERLADGGILRLGDRVAAPSPSPLHGGLEEAWARDRREGVVATTHGASGLWTIVSDDYLRPAVLEENLRALEKRSPFLLVRVGWTGVWVGPYVEPGQSACGACLVERLGLNQPERRHIYEAVDGACGAQGRVRRLRPSVRPDSFSALEAALGELTAGPRARAKLRNQVIVCRLDGGGRRAHPVERIPHCPACGDASWVPPGDRIEIRSRWKTTEATNGARTELLSETQARFCGRVSPLTGLVRAIDRVPTPGCREVHVYTANHATHWGPLTFQAARDRHRDHSGGKGATEAAARISALCEAVERVAAVHREGPHRVASADELGDGGVLPNSVQLFSSVQFASRQAWNERHRKSFHWVPDPYCGKSPISWTRMRSLVTGSSRWVPTGLVYLGFDGPGADYCRGDSNGLAAGNCLEEAILQAFLELVERDTVAIWWYNELSRPGVQLAGADPWIDAVLAEHRGLGRALWALDLTTDLEIPVYAAISARMSDPEEIIFGFGAHLDPRIAARRAVSEVNQMLPTVLRDPEARRQQLLPDFPEALEWWRHATRERFPYLVPDPARPSVAIEATPQTMAPDLRDDLEYCLSVASDRQLDVLVHDLTRPDHGVSTARVIVPGLRHFWRRLGPGRLYEVPVAMGARASPRAEAEMNPISVFV